MEQQKAVFNELVSHITDMCYDKCIPKPGGESETNLIFLRQRTLCKYTWTAEGLVDAWAAATQVSWTAASRRA